MRIPICAGVISMTLASSPATGSTVDDIVVGYSLMHITSARVGGRTVSPTFNRQNIELQLGVGDFTLGTIVQRATPSPTTKAGEAETGLMVTAGYGRPVADWLSFDAFARVGVSRSNGGQPLYATDTDLRLKLVAFDPQGWGPVDAAWFPSVYVGSIVNRFGRVQAIAGAGMWWSGIGVYATGLYSFNGVVDPMLPGVDQRMAFAAAKNAAVTLSASYDLDLDLRNTLHVEVRKNIPFRNAGNELVGVVELRHFFE